MRLSIAAVGFTSGDDRDNCCRTATRVLPSVDSTFVLVESLMPTLSLHAGPSVVKFASGETKG
jgi:hypothetical protein